MGRHLMVYCVRLFGTLTMLANSLAVKRRWFPRVRFSLRTLLLFVLLIASGGTLWWNWGPWVVAFTVDEPGEIGDAFFSDDDRFLVVSYSNLEVEGGSCWADVRNASTGTRHLLLNCCGPQIWLSGDYVIFMTSAGERPVPAIYNFVTGERLNYENSQGPAETLSDPVIQGNYIFLFSKDHYVLARLPGLEKVRTIKAERADLTARGLFISERDRVQVHDLATGTVIETPEIKGLLRNWSNRSTSAAFTASVFQGERGKEIETQYAFDARTGELIGRLPYPYANLSFDGRRAVFNDEWTGGIGLKKMRDLKSQQDRCIDSAATTTKDIRFSVDDSLILDRYGIMYDATTLRKLWDHSPADAEFSRDGEFVFAYSKVTGPMKRGAVLEARSGRMVMSFSGLRWLNLDASHARDYWMHHASTFALCRRTNSTNDPALLKSVPVFHLCRPIQWYGVAWLPEFWLTVVLGVGLVWSFWRDRRMA